jgi:hypothetical protein
LHPSQTFNMADEGEVSALVCDNGSGMVKVRERPQIWAHPTSFPLSIEGGHARSGAQIRPTRTHRTRV